MPHFVVDKIQNALNNHPRHSTFATVRQALNVWAAKNIALLSVP
jgi:hypothetical protein